MSRTRSWLLRIWRLCALAVAAWLLHVAAEKNERNFRQPSTSIEQALRFFPDAVRVAPAKDKNAADEVYDVNDRLIGFVTTTSPQADSVLGYAGPNNVLAGLDTRGKIVGLELLSSDDTDAHVRQIKSAKAFWEKFIGWAPSHEPLPKIEGVAGSTLTSLGIAEALQKRLAGRTESLRFPDPLTLEEVRALFASAATFQPVKERVGWYLVKSDDGKELGFAVRTSPFADYTRGHSGPTECLLAVTMDKKRMTGVRLRKSYDTEEYVQSVRDDSDYLKQLTGFSVDQWAVMDLKKSGLEGVSGATETSFAVAEGIKRTFSAKALTPVPTEAVFKARDFAMMGIVLGSLVMTFTGLRGRRLARLAWQAILIFVFGLLIGDLLSIALLVGWARNGVAWQTASGLVLLAGVALLVPWTTRQQIYCYELCPHGAAQEWLGRFKKLHLHLPRGVEKLLRFLPGALLSVAFLVALVFFQFDLATIEPFDAWALRGTAVAATVIAVVGLVAALFVPMAYCRFGCPTGALLRFTRSTGSNDRFNRRDWSALLVLLAGGALTFFPTGSATEHAHTTELHGKAFGTSWSVKLRHPPANTAALQQSLSAELERIESSLSHWRTNSATSQFNLAQTTQPMELPGELVSLVARALEISRASDGSFDITVAPLVRAWGFGPEGTQAHAPSDEEVARLRTFTGWQKLIVDTNANTLRKSDPRLQIDMGAILQGYAADRLALLLGKNNQTNFLINVGGELLAHGRWRVAIENPAASAESANKPLCILFLNDGALATSGTYRAKHADGKKHWTHLIDPATGKPVEHQTSLVSVIHRSCAQADAWATALIVAGDKRAETLALKNGLPALILSNGVVVPVHFPPTN